MDKDIEILIDSVMVAQGDTPLMEACSRANYAAIVDQLQNGADVNAVSNDGRSALLLAARYAYEDESNALKIVELLLDHGADINAQSLHEGETAVMQAVYYNYPDILKLLIARGAAVNLRRADGTTALSSVEQALGVAKKRKRVIKILEQAGGIR